MTAIDLDQLEATLNEASANPSQAAHDSVRKGISDLRTQRGFAGQGDRKSIVPQPQHNPAVVPPGRPVEAILAEREKTYGDFGDNARIAQSLKRVIWNEEGWGRFNAVQREAAEMICLKLGRALAGNPNVHDHWDDIAGYAKLVSERIP